MSLVDWLYQLASMHTLLVIVAVILGVALAWVIIYLGVYLVVHIDEILPEKLMTRWLDFLYRHRL